MNPKEGWKERFFESLELADQSFDAITGFNANIDVVHKTEDLELELDTEPELVTDIEDIEDLKKTLKYCIEHGENHEVNLKTDIGFEGRKRIGGQAGIMAQLLSNTGNGTIFYTPFLSEELASLMNENILYPGDDDGVVFKNIEDAVNTDKTKENHIFEFQEGKSGRLILSDTLKGFGPYFRNEAEKNLEVLEDNADCIFVSGFHNVKGNRSAKLKKSAEQLSQFETPVHLEFVHRDDRLSRKVLKHVAPCVDSIGVDETEFKKVVELTTGEELDEKVSLGEAVHQSQKVLEKLHLDRIHLHTYRYHLTLTGQDYGREMNKIQKAMLYGEITAVQLADKGKIPETSEVKDFDMKNKRIHDLDELEDYGSFTGEEDFLTDGKKELDGFKAVAIPTIIHEDPEMTVGMGDVISCSSFGSEFKKP